MCTCRICSREFVANPNYRHALGYCSDNCRAVGRKEVKSNYKKTEKGKLAELRWRNNPKKSAIDKAYRQTPEARAKAVKRVTKYLQSHEYAREKKRELDREYGKTERGKMVNRKAAQRYRETEKGTLTRGAIKAARRGAPGKFSADELKECFEKHGNKCVHCGSASNLTVDHIVPLKLGGDNYITNIQPLCKSCNSKKGARHVG